MRILLLGPVHNEREFLKQKGDYPFFRYQAQNSYVDALRSLGHIIEIFRFTDSFIFPNSFRIHSETFFQQSSPLIYAKARRLLDKFYFLVPENILKNQRLLEIAEKFNPEILIFSGGTSSIFPQTLEKIKMKFSCPVLLLWGINSKISSTKPERDIVQKGIVDLVVENDCGYADIWRKMGAKRVIVLPISGIDPLIHRKLDLSKDDYEKYKSDVCFVGTLTENRQNLLEKLIQAKYSLKIWGYLLNKGLKEKLKPAYQGIAYGEKMVKIFNCSKIALNFQPPDMKCGGNMRTFEIPGCGAFQLADRIDEKWFKSGKEVMLFKDEEDLLTKIKYFLNQEKERAKIANSGFMKAHNQHTYKDHFKKLLNLIKV